MPGSTTNTGSRRPAARISRKFYDAIAKDGWRGMTIPEKCGGDDLGITEATLLLEEVSRSGAAMNQRRRNGDTDGGTDQRGPGAHDDEEQR